MRNDRYSGPKKTPTQSNSRGKNPNHKFTGAPPRLDQERTKKEIERFAELAICEMGLELTREASISQGADGPELSVRFSGADEGMLLEQNAELLLALEYLCHRMLRLDPRLHDQIRFDCGDYRATRLDELKLSARVAAQRVRETGQDFHFNPMTPRDRRIIHLELTGAQGVRTESEGIGDRRHLVIHPANKK